MKALTPKSFTRLPMSEKKKIEEVMEFEIERRMLVILDIFLKMCCQVLNETEHMGESRLMCFLGNFHRIFNQHSQLVKDGKQIEFLDERMRKIFRKSGYPDEFFRTMFGEKWDIYTGKREKENKT